MNLGGKTLADWLLAQPVENLPMRNFAYQENYAALALNLLPLHREVTATANRVDGGYLTDHGPDHIRKLISRIPGIVYPRTYNQRAVYPPPRFDRRRRG